MKGEEMPTGVYVMRQIILKMIHSRKFSPGPDWLTPQIGKGRNLDKTFSALKMLTRPELTTKWDVDLVFFDDGRRMTPETFQEFCAGEHATECIARGGPCATHRGFLEFCSHFSNPGYDPRDRCTLPLWMQTPSERL